MRVIAGEYRSRKLKTVSGMSVRPTPDRLREALFNVLASRLAGAVFLDAYAGTGAVGIEALSRGAKQIILLEKSAEALSILQENLNALGVREGAIVARGSAARLIPRYLCDIAFVDPPYDRPAEYAESMNALSQIECPLVIAQHASKQPLAGSYGNLKRFRVLRQGDNSLSFYELNRD